MGNVQNRPLERFISHFLQTKNLFVITSILMTDIGDEMCWWQLLYTDGKLVTVLAILVTNIHYLLTLVTHIEIQSPISTDRNQL